MPIADCDSYYRSRFVFDPDRDAVWKEICRFMQRSYIPPASVILEVGAGYCHFINNIQGESRHALDLSSELPKYADPGVVSHVQSCTSMQLFQDRTFDVVFASNLFEHVTREETEKALTEIRRVLKKTGKFIIVQPNFRYCYKHYFDDYTHVQIFTDVGLGDLLTASGFRVLELKPRFLPFSMKSRFPKIPLLVRLYLMFPLKPFAGQMLIVSEISE